MNINIENYLSDDEIRQIIKDEIIDSIRNSNDKERIFYNAVSKYLSDEMNKTEWDELSKLLKDKAKKAIENKDLSYELFRKPDVWDRSEWYSYKILQSVCNDNKDILDEKVKSIINKLWKKDIWEKLSEVIYDLFNKK